MRISQKPAFHETQNLKSTGPTSAVEHIRKQIDQLQKELEKVKGSKDSPEMKSARTKELNGQIEMLQQNLQQAVMDEGQKKREEVASKAAEKVEKEATKHMDAEQLKEHRQSATMLAVHSKYSEIITLRRVQVAMIARKNLEGAANITGRIMEKSMEVQEIIKRASEFDPGQAGLKRDKPSDGKNQVEGTQGQAPQGQATEDTKTMEKGETQEQRNEEEKRRFAFVDIKV
jgi:hypothetical protein